MKPNREFWYRKFAHHMTARLGVKKLPAEGMPLRDIEGVQVYVAALKGEKPQRGKRHTHRVIAICPECSQEMSAGRVHQHSCVKQRKGVWS